MNKENTHLSCEITIGVFISNTSLKQSKSYKDNFSGETYIYFDQNLSSLNVLGTHKLRSCWLCIFKL